MFKMQSHDINQPITVCCKICDIVVGVVGVVVGTALVLGFDDLTLNVKDIEVILSYQPYNSGCPPAPLLHPANSLAHKIILAAVSLCLFLFS